MILTFYPEWKKKVRIMVMPVVNTLLQQYLLDENILSLIPILLGKGTGLFKDNVPEQLMTLVSVRAYDTRLVQLHYRKKER